MLMDAMFAAYISPYHPRAEKAHAANIIPEQHKLQRSHLANCRQAFVAASINCSEEMLRSQTLALNAEPELRAEDAYEWTQGRVVFADRKRRDLISSSIKLASGQEFQPSAQLGSLCT